MEQDTVAHGLRGQFVKVPVGDGSSMAVYMAKPLLSKPRPVVIIAHHAVGVYHHSFLRSFADRLADEGYVAMLPDFFHRAWSDEVVTGAGLPFEAMNIQALLGSLRDEQLLADLNATISILERDKEADSSRVAVLGFCMGGRIAWLAAVEESFREKVHAAVAYHGGNVFKGVGEGALPPSERIQEGLHCPVLGHFGAEDTNPSEADMKRLEGLAGDRLVTLVYEGAKHGFSCEDSSNYVKDAATRAFSSTLTFLERAMEVPAVSSEEM